MRRSSEHDTAAALHFFGGPAWSFLNCFGHVAGGARQRPSAREKAQTDGIAFFAQISGLVCLQPTVCFSLSPPTSGS
jgi:hypothetical protein